MSELSLSTLLNRTTHYSTQIIRNINGVTGLRPEDVWLTSFPRSGNSWMRIILANVIYLTEKEGKEVDLRTLAYLLPSFGFADLHLSWQYQCVPRFVKTHHPFRYPFFSKPKRSVLLIRDPRDAILSYHDLAQKSKIIAFRGSISEFLRHSKYGLPAWLRHYESWQSRATVIMKYEDLRKDTVATLQQTFSALSVEIDRQIIEEAVERSAIQRMREKEAETGLGRPDRFDSSFRAVRSGKSRSWQNEFSESDQLYFEKIFTKKHGYNYNLMDQAAPIREQIGASN